MLLRILLVAVSLAPLAAQEIPAGTVLPVMLSSSLNAEKARPGAVIKGSLMQPVALPDGSRLPRGASVRGHIVAADASPAPPASRLVLQFDRIIARGRAIPIVTTLRAVASMTEVYEAQMPTNDWDDYGTSSSDWNTLQVGGDVVYRGDGRVTSAGGDVVGKATDSGDVTAHLLAAGSCRADASRAQSLWVFSASACGIYGFSDLRIAHAGRTSPKGQIVLEGAHNVKVSGGSGWLLRVIGSGD